MGNQTDQTGRSRARAKQTMAIGPWGNRSEYDPHKWWLFHIYLGKLSYFTNLNCWAIKGDHFPQSNYEIVVRENSEAVMKFTQIYVSLL